jgi:hypothetical protein
MPDSPQGDRSIAENGIPARLVLAVLESAGILYAALSPVIVTGPARMLDRKNRTGRVIW